MEHFCTSEVPAPMRVAYWEDVASRTFTGLNIAPVDDGAAYESSLTTARLGGLSMARPVTQAVRLHHGRDHIARLPERAFLVHHQISGSCDFTQDGRQVHLDEGDFVLTDTARPYEFRLSPDNAMLVVRVPEAALGPWRRVADGLFATRACGQSPGGMLLSNYLSTLWQQMTRMGDARLPTHAGKVMVDLIEMSWTPVNTDQKTRSDVKRDTIIDFIAQHLFEPDLSVGRIAAGLNVTPRYIQKLLAEISTTPSHYIAQERMKAAARFLADDGKADLSVSDIAYLVGFSDLSHFSRSFKSQFGQSPAAWRRGRRPA